MIFSILITKGVSPQHPVLWKPLYNHYVFAWVEYFHKPMLCVAYGKRKKKTCAAPSINFNRHCLSFSKSSRVSGQEGSRNTGCAALTLTNTAVFIQSSVSILNHIWWGRCRRRFCSPLHACCFLLGCTDRSDSSPALQAALLPWVSDVIRL